MNVQHTSAQDLDGIASVEFDRYATLYAEDPAKKAWFISMLPQRLAVASEWMWVLKDDGKVLGSLSAQPTSSKPEDFKSWEVSTNKGTLEGTYDRSGRSVYVVNLDVLREGTKRNGQYMIMAYLAAKVVSTDKDMVYFESRMPGFRDWVKAESINWTKADRSQQDAFAKQYAALKDNSGRLHDKLLKFYDEAGFSNFGVVAEAFDDPESLNYGAVFYATNPLPRVLRLWPARKATAFILRTFARYPKVLDLVL